LVNLDKAKALVQYFGYNNLIPRATIDVYLTRVGAMPPDASPRERHHYRHGFAQKVATASTSTHMRDIGLVPFEIICETHGWRLEDVQNTIERNRPIKKMLTQAQRSAKRQKYLVESIDPTCNESVHLQATMQMKLTSVLEDVARVAMNGVEKLGDEVKTLLERTMPQSRLLMQEALNHNSGQPVIEAGA